MTPHDGLLLIFGGFVVFLLLLAVPVPFALGLTALVAIAVSGTVPLAAVPINLVNSMETTRRGRASPCARSRCASWRRCPR